MHIKIMYICINYKGSKYIIHQHLRHYCNYNIHRVYTNNSNKNFLNQFELFNIMR
jgi:hypothetical protein